MANIIPCSGWMPDPEPSIRVREKAKRALRYYRDFGVQHSRRYYRANKDKERQRYRNVRARRAKSEGKHTLDEVWQMAEDQGHLCAYCETPLFGTFDVDHMIPLDCGGSNDWTNLAIACKWCNQSKHTKTAEEFMRYLRERV